MRSELVGLNPWLPPPLSRWPWWTRPVRAERLAALRIGLAAVLLLDLLFTYLPRAGDFFGPDSLGSPGTFADRGSGGNWHWSLLWGVHSLPLLRGLLWVWTGAAVLLLVGWWTRAAAAVAWVLSLSFLNLNFFAHNAGDTIRVIGLFYLMLSPSGAVWSFDRLQIADCRLQIGKRSPDASSQSAICNLQSAIFVSPWPLRLLFVQLAAIYFFSGIHKLANPAWRSGATLHYILGDLSLARWPGLQPFAPLLLTRLATWLVLAWEITFPLLVLLPRTRIPALVLGALLHVALGLSVELGLFPLYMLCLYLPLLPCEKLSRTLHRTVRTA